VAAHHLILSPAAKADLKDIYQYGLRQWGQAQSDRNNVFKLFIIRTRPVSMRNRALL
jgi:hypothetical protein